MRFFLRSRVPAPRRLLLVESGSRRILERAYGQIRSMFPGAQFDLCTCFPAIPEPGGFAHVFRVTEAHGLLRKVRLLLAILRSRPPLAAMLFTNEPVLFPWKMGLLALLPAKVLVINENADFFWLDWSNRRTLAQFMRARMGVDGVRLLRSSCRLLAFPFVMLFLAVYALAAYVVHWARRLAWSVSGRPAAGE